MYIERLKTSNISTFQGIRYSGVYYLYLKNHKNLKKPLKTKTINIQKPKFKKIMVFPTLLLCKILKIK